MIVPRQRKTTFDPHLHASLAAPLVPGETIDAGQFAYTIVEPAATGDANRLRLLDAYQCWRTTWAPVLRDLDVVNHLFSDEFTRQDEIGALTYRSRCIGLSAFRFVDLSLSTSLDDSYFRAWPREAIAALTAHGSKVCIGSNLAILEPWRSAARGFSVKQLLMGLAVQRFLASSADSMAGMVRNDRGMDRLVYGMGAAPLAHNVVIHGIESDLVGFFRGNLAARPSRKALSFLIEKLWRTAAHPERFVARARRGANRTSV
jgi:hypothetical protein